MNPIALKSIDTDLFFFLDCEVKLKLLGRKDLSTIIPLVCEINSNGYIELKRPSDDIVLIIE